MTKTACDRCGGMDEVAKSYQFLTDSESRSYGPDDPVPHYVAIDLCDSCATTLVLIIKNESKLRKLQPVMTGRKTGAK